MEQDYANEALASLSDELTLHGLDSAEYLSRVMDLIRASYSEAVTGRTEEERSITTSGNRYDRDATRYVPLNHLIFVSSTFKDMQEERDTLQSDLLPRLRQACAKHGETVELVDLRWGIGTKGLDEDARMAAIVQSCLREVDRCRPHLVCLVGDRYGTILEEREWERCLPEDKMRELKQMAGECEGIDLAHMSLTAAEVIYGTTSLLPKPSEPIVCRRRSNGLSSANAYEAAQGQEELDSLIRYLTNLPGEVTIDYEKAASADTRRPYELRCCDDGLPLADRLYEAIIESFTANWEGADVLGPFDRMWVLNEHFAVGHSEDKLPVFDLGNGILDAIEMRRPIVWVREREGSQRTSLLASLYCSMTSNGWHVASLFPDAVGDCSANEAMSFLEISLRLSLGLEAVPHGKHLSPPNDTASWAKRFRKAIEEWETKGRGTPQEGPWLNNHLAPIMVAPAGGSLRTLSDQERLRGTLHGSPDRAFVLVDSVFDIDGLPDLLTGVSQELRDLRLTFILTCSSSELAVETDAVLDVPNMSGSKLRDFVASRCEARGRQLPEGARELLAGREQCSAAYATLLAANLDLINADVLAHTRGRDLEAAITKEVAFAPDDTVGLCWRLVGAACRGADKRFVDTFVDALAVARYGLTKDELQGVFSLLGTPWEELAFYHTKNALLPLIKETASGVLSLVSQSFGESAIDLCPRRGEVSGSVLTVSASRGLATHREVENALRAGLGCKAYALLANLITTLTYDCGPEGLNTLRRATLRVCSYDGGQSMALLLIWLADLIESSGFNENGRIGIQSSDGEAELDPRGVFAYFKWFLWHIRNSGAATDRMAVNVGEATLRLWGALERSGIDVGYLNDDGSVQRLSRDVKAAGFRSDPNRWEGVIFAPSQDERITKVRVKSKGVMGSMIGDSYEWNKIMIHGTQCYDLDTHANWVPREINDARLAGYGDAGIVYILANGYPYAYPYQGNSEASTYITQAALFMYIAEIGCSSPLSDDFLYNSADIYGVRGIMWDLVKGALEARAKSEGSGKGVATINGKRCCAKVYESQSMRATAKVVVLEAV